MTTAASKYNKSRINLIRLMIFANGDYVKQLIGLAKTIKKQSGLRV